MSNPKTCPIGFFWFRVDYTAQDVSNWKVAPVYILYIYIAKVTQTSRSPFARATLPRAGVSLLREWGTQCPASRRRAASQCHRDDSASSRHVRRCGASSSRKSGDALENCAHVSEAATAPLEAPGVEQNVAYPASPHHSRSQPCAVVAHRSPRQPSPSPPPPQQRSARVPPDADVPRYYAVSIEPPTAEQRAAGDMVNLALFPS